MEIVTRPILRIGSTNDGRFKFTKDKLLEILENTKKAISDGHKISVKLGHYDNEQRAKGWVENLRFGTGNLKDAIVGDFISLLPEVLSDINEGRLPQVSAEISPRFITKKGDEIGELLNAVALLGIDRPAVHFTAEDKYKNEGEILMNFEDEIKRLSIENANQTGEVIKLKAEIEVKDEKLTKLSAEISELTAKNEKLEAENKSLSSIKKDLEKLEADKFVSKLLSERKIYPAEKDSVLTMYNKFGKDACEEVYTKRNPIPDTLFKELAVSDGEENKNQAQHKADLDIAKTFGVSELWEDKGVK